VAKNCWFAIPAHTAMLKLRGNEKGTSLISFFKGNGVSTFLGDLEREP